jgi:FRG domain
MPHWPWWSPGAGPDAYRIRELLRAIWDLHAMYGADSPWLWRGQANGTFALEPAIHTRVRNQATLDDASVESFTRALIQAAREATLDVNEGTTLPDMALLALLQHHGAATPLLDISLDPVVGLYMAIVSPAPSDDDRPGALFAIRRPARSIADFDSRPFNAVYQWVGNDVAFYSAPDVSQRLRIQRGHFLLGRVSTASNRVTIPLSVDLGGAGDNWIGRRMAARGVQGPAPPATSDVGVFRIAPKFKPAIREWLEERSGLTRDFVFPTAWHQPYLERFAASHGRTAAF